MLQKCEEKKLTFDDLWDKKINSAVSNISICIILLVNEMTNLVNQLAA